MLAVKLLTSICYYWGPHNTGFGDRMCMHGKGNLSHSKEGNTDDAKAREKGVRVDLHITIFTYVPRVPSQQKSHSNSKSINRSTHTKVTFL